MVQHARTKFEDKNWAESGLQEESVDEFVIRVGGSDDAANESESSSGSYIFTTALFWIPFLLYHLLHTKHTH